MERLKKIEPQTNISTVALLTSKLDAARLPFSHKISRTQNNGLEADSVALIFQIRSLTMTAGRFLFRMGSVEMEHFKNIKTLIIDYLKIE
jgi:mRNA-degrading endonuclease toxin of MazEF toxin-antitoxin module